MFDFQITKLKLRSSTSWSKLHIAFKKLVSFSLMSLTRHFKFRYSCTENQQFKLNTHFIDRTQNYISDVSTRFPITVVIWHIFSQIDCVIFPSIKIKATYKIYLKYVKVFHAHFKLIQQVFVMIGNIFLNFHNINTSK